MKYLSLILCLFIGEFVHAQPERWQQRISYQIDVNMNVSTNQFTGTEKIN
ncbi:MAG: hypothetical protein ABIY35_08615 [Chitinophagaceae bacterium]